MKSKRNVFACLAALLIAIVAGTALAGDTAPARPKMSCADYARAIKTPAQPQALVPGSWGNVPAELRKLPPGAEHCGADIRTIKDGLAVIASPLNRDELEKFYAPLFAQVGCPGLKCDVIKTKIGKKDAEQTRCACHAKGTLGTVATDTGAEVFEVSLFRY